VLVLVCISIMYYLFIKHAYKKDVKIIQTLSVYEVLIIKEAVQCFKNLTSETVECNPISVRGSNLSVPSSRVPKHIRSFSPLCQKASNMAPNVWQSVYYWAHVNIEFIDLFYTNIVQVYVYGSHVSNRVQLG